jgi:hypothetical protein
MSAMLHHLIIAIGAAYAAVQSLEFARRVAIIGQTSMAIGFPMVFAHSALVVGRPRRRSCSTRRA